MSFLNNGLQPQPLPNQTFGGTSPIVPLLPSPSVYDESMDMLSAANFIYTFADLRDLARSKKTPLSIENLEPPMSTAQMFDVISANKEALVAEELYDDLESKLDNTFMKGNNMVEFEDENSQKELVHGIFVNHDYKRITVVFRGSVTQKDFITDAKVGQEQVDKPGLAKNKKEATMNIHSGFHKYLFKKSKTTDKTRCEEIMDSVKHQLKENPGYQLYCCGHSLGGALCTLFGLYASSDQEINDTLTSPVRVYSVASPLVGNVKFRNAFQTMEHQRKIQHFRMANAEDVVTQMPVAAPKLSFKSGAINLYKHCGIKILLSDTSTSFELSYTQDQSSDDEYAKEIETVVDDMKNVASSVKKVVKEKKPEEVAKYHGCGTYKARLQQCKQSLENITLDELYNDRNLVGNILDPDFEPKVMLTATERILKIGSNPMLQKTIKNAFKKSKNKDSKS